MWNHGPPGEGQAWLRPLPRPSAAGRTRNSLWPSGPIGPACGSRLQENPIETCAIGLKYARQAAGHTGSGCHEICVTEKDVLDALDTVVYTLDMYDITAVRAGMGM